MNLEELVKSLGLEGDEHKEKVAILKKEYNATQKALHKLEDENAKLNETVTADKAVADKLNIVVNAFGLDLKAKDFDENIESAKDNTILLFFNSLFISSLYLNSSSPGPFLKINLIPHLSL